MGKNPDPPANMQKYGVPFYAAAWIPHKAIKSKDPEEEEDSESTNSQQYYVVFSGGGGEGQSGIPNALVVSRFDFSSKSLSNKPVAKLVIGSDLPYRMAVHPGGDGLICSSPKSCRWFEWDGEKSNVVDKLGLKLSDKLFTDLENVGQQLALVFNNEGSAFAAGGEDGKLQVFKWPSMECILNKDGAHTIVKDLDFSPDGKYLVSVGNSGPGSVWDLTSLKVASLPKQNDEVFCACRFSRSNDRNEVLYTAAVKGKGGVIVTWKWNTTEWKRSGPKSIVRDTISAFNISPDGKLLACGTVEGDILILNSTSMRIQTMVRKAHLGVVTALVFSHDSRALASASWDSSARVTLTEDKKKTGGSSLWVYVVIIILAIAIYFIKNEGILT